jgi:hypothetical protein
VTDAEQARETVFAALTRQRVVETLSRLSLPDLTDLLDEVLRTRTTTDPSGDEHHLVLAVASWFPGHTTQPGAESYLAALGLPTPDRKDPYYPAGFCQMGTCPTCWTELVSDLKRVRCPVCHTPTSLS